VIIVNGNVVSSGEWQVDSTSQVTVAGNLTVGGSAVVMVGASVPTGAIFIAEGCASFSGDLQLQTTSGQSGTSTTPLSEVAAYGLFHKKANRRLIWLSMDATTGLILAM